jgi:hypothetical protein
MQIHPNIAPPTHTLLSPTRPGGQTNLKNPMTTDDRSSHYDFESMTIGEFIDAINELHSSGQITFLEMNDLASKYEWVFPGMSKEQTLAMPAKISFDELRQDIATSYPGSAAGDPAWLERVLDVLQRFDGKLRTLDISA